MPPVIQPGEPVGDGEALQLALALALPHAGHQVLEHLRQLAHLAPTARRELDRVVPGGHSRVTRFLNTCVSWPTSPPPPVGSSTEWSPAATLAATLERRRSGRTSSKPT